MQLISTIAELRARLNEERSVAFVPTMGNLHEGHLNLVRLAREHGDCVVASIFVNPLQFGPSEDFERYPRTLDADCAMLRDFADIVFAPPPGEMYPAQQTVFIELPPVADELCGAARPGHFCGMATVVLKLLNIVQPQVALFGKKDYQQLHLIRQLVAQLNLPVNIIGGETVRAADGLALSSRNQYLSATERSEAVFLYQMLQGMRLDILQGERDFERLRQQTAETLAARGWSVDYVAVRNQSDLQPASDTLLAQPAVCGRRRGDGIPAPTACAHRVMPSASPAQDDLAQRELVVLAAARLGNTRLLDNVEVCAAD